MKRVGLWAMGIGLFITVGLITVEQGYAEEKDHAPTCTLETLKGRYLFAMFGLLSPTAFGIMEQTPSDAAGFHIFDGKGGGSDIVTFRLGGILPSPFDMVHPQEVPISYTVNADCTGSYTVLIPGGPSFDIFIAPDGESIATIATGTEGNQGSSISRRVSPK